MREAVSLALAALLFSGVAGGILFAPGPAEAAGANLIVEGYSTGGSPVSMWITVESGGSTVKTGFTKLVHSGSTGTTYKVTASDYSAGGIYFDRWGNGSTNRERYVTLSEDTWITAYYRTGGGVNSSSGSGGSSSPPAPSSSTGGSGNSMRSTGVYVPLYKYPDLWDSNGMWNAVIKAKKAHPLVPFSVAYNPSSGPGTSYSSTIHNAVRQLDGAGVEHILGYMATKWGRQPAGYTLADLKVKIDRYRAWYPETDGLMLDEMASTADKVPFYRDLVNYAKSKGFTFIKGNPGAKVDRGYIGLLTNISVYEGSGAPSLSKLSSNTYYPGYSKSNFAFTAKDVWSLDSNYVRQARAYVGYMYMTNDGSGNPYNTVPPYFNSMVAALDSP
ncbi:spherulation-specific family 4 protein [Nitrososphaera sp.]|uniref:spherulation-specific family 4 protein n=1 Tax=Nitrososphaera sp. TaxID=1971748 RepID=UPI00307E0CA8